MATIKEVDDLDMILHNRLARNSLAFMKRHEGIMGITKEVGLNIEGEKAQEAKRIIIRKARQITITMIVIVIFIILIVGINIY